MWYVTQHYVSYEGIHVYSVSKETKQNEVTDNFKFIHLLNGAGIFILVLDYNGVSCCDRIKY